MNHDLTLAFAALDAALDALDDAACDLSLAEAPAGPARGFAGDARVLAEAVEAEARALRSVLGRHR